MSSHSYSSGSNRSSSITRETMQSKPWSEIEKMYDEEVKRSKQKKKKERCQEQQQVDSPQPYYSGRVGNEGQQHKNPSSPSSQPLQSSLRSSRQDSQESPPKSEVKKKKHHVYHSQNHIHHKLKQERLAKKLEREQRVKENSAPTQHTAYNHSNRNRDTVQESSSYDDTNRVVAFANDAGIYKVATTVTFPDDDTEEIANVNTKHDDIENSRYTRPDDDSHFYGSQRRTQQDGGRHEAAEEQDFKPIYDQYGEKINRQSKKRKHKDKGPPELAINYPRRYFKFELAAHTIFVIASIFYIWLEVIAYNWAKEAQNYPIELLTADDDYVWDVWAREQYELHQLDLKRQQELESSGVNGVIMEKTTKLGKKHGNTGSAFTSPAQPRSITDTDTTTTRGQGGGRYLTDLLSSLLYGDENDNHYNAPPKLKKVGGRIVIKFNDYDYYDNYYYHDNYNEHRSLSYYATDDNMNNNIYTERNDSPPVDNNSQETINNPRLLFSYQDVYWKKLPTNVLNAATSLGYDRDSWDNKEPIPVQGLPWEKLTSEQQAAAKVFGYSSVSWPGGSSNSHSTANDSPAPTEKETTSMPTTPTDREEIIDNDNNMNNGNIEFDDTTDAINGGQSVEEEDDVLINSEPVVGRNALNDSGNNQDISDGPSKTATTETAAAATTTTTTTVDENEEASTSFEQWREYEWLELPDDIRQAAIILGYNANRWNNELTVFTDELPWADLTESERNAAIALGYTREKWDSIEGDVETFLGDNENPPTKEEWQKYDWVELPENIQLASILLGYNEYRWDNKVSVFSDSMRWSQLTNNERDAATLLGYNQTTWHSSTSSLLGQNEETAGEGNDQGAIDYDDYYWRDLPEDVKDAAVVLGYNERMWNNDGIVHTDDLYWIQLTPEQQAAAVVFGYDQVKWDADDSGIEINVGNGNVWEDYWWDDLPAGIQGAATVLGYNENLWNNDGVAFTDDLYWSQLTADQQAAASVFGYDEESWNYDDTSGKWANYEWSELPDIVQVAAMVLGYDQNSWDNDILVYSENYSWAELNNEQQGAAQILGYTQGTWDRTDLTPSGASINWEDLSWSELPEYIIGAALILGYNEESWNEDSETYTSTLSWDQLSNNQKTAAAVLGYHQGKWDAGSTTSGTPNWDEFWWSDLPAYVKDAALILGYNEDSWNNDIPAFTDDLSWAELTDEQKTAAAVLGYGQAQWDGDGDADGLDPVDSTVASSSSTIETTIDWEDYWWRELPEYAQIAARKLGYNENSWDNDILVFTDDLEWKQLTNDEKGAAAVLGYNQGKWDETSTTSTNYDVLEWAELPQYAQDAAVILGYNETIWDNDGIVFSEDLYWKELSVGQKYAAAVLGYYQQKWDGFDASLSSTEWDDTSWSDLPVNIQEAAAIIGYEEKSWDSGIPIPIEDKFWNELSNEQRDAATVMGYTPDIWDAHKDTIDWDDYDWSELPEDIKATAAILGYDEASWNKDLQVFTDELYWEELTPEQREAAGVLGYTEESWDLVGFAVDDDYVFRVGGEDGSWVTREMIIYFMGAFGFVIIGILDLYSQRQWFHAFMLVAGISGVASACLVEKDIRWSNIMNSVSVHCFLLEAFVVYRNHHLSRDTPQIYVYLLYLADLLFVVGSFIDVVLSYYYLTEAAEWNMRLAIVALLASVLWLICAMIYVFITIALEKKRLKNMALNHE